MSDSLHVDPRNLVAEVVGTFALIFVGAGSIIVTGGTNLVGIAIAHGLALALLASALVHVSGALFNPALTIGLWVIRQLDTINTVAYIIAQLVGAVLGAVALLLLFPEAMREASKLGTPLLNPGLSFSQGVGLEVVLTMFLMLVLLGSSIDQRGAKIGGFGVGLALTMGYLVAGPLTLAAMNPARAFGPALMSGEWADHLAYWIGPIIGAVLAALLYQYAFSEPTVATASELASEDTVEPSNEDAGEAPDEAVEPADDEAASVGEALVAELDAEVAPESGELESDEGSADSDAEQSGDSDEAGDDEEES